LVIGELVMMIALMPLLAVDEIELIILSIGFLIVVGGKIANSLKQNRQQHEQPRDDDSSAQARKARLEALAARRREQLRRTAQQPPAPPTNLTAPQQAQRSEAKSLYERRAEALRRARQQPQSPAQRMLVETLEAEHVHAHTETEGRVQAEARRRQEDLARQQRLNSIAERENRMEQARQEQRRKRDVALGASTRGAERTPPGHAGTTHRHVADADSSAYAIGTGGTSRFRAALAAGSLKDAIVLREVFGPPKALSAEKDLIQ